MLCRHEALRTSSDPPYLPASRGPMTKPITPDLRSRRVPTTARSRWWRQVRVLTVLTACVFAGAPAAFAVTLTASRADVAVARALKQAALRTLHSLRSEDPVVAVKPNCKPRAAGVYRCAYSLSVTFAVHRDSLACTGVIVLAEGSKTIDVKQTAPMRCVKVPATASPGTLSFTAAERAISGYAEEAGANSGLGNVITAAAIPSTCTRVSAHEIRCSYEVDLSDPSGESTFQCIEPPALAYTKGKSSHVYVAGSFEATDCSAPSLG